MPKYFGTDGIRGRANETLTAKTAYKLGESLALLNNKIVIIGYDTRISSQMFMHSVSAGALSKGLDVIVAGVVSTPGLIYATKVKKSIGVMITASHNPYYDNGLKVVMNGEKLNEEKQSLLEEYLDDLTTIPNNEIGRSIIEDCLIEYKLFLNKFISKENNLKICMDTANGATSYLVSELFKDYSIIANTPNGYNINEKVGSTNISNIIDFVKENKYDIGFAFDGDGDRVIACDINGEVFDGDKIIYILGNYFKSKGILNGDTVVLTKMSNLGIINALKNKGITSVLTDVGDKYVLNEIKKSNYSLGGENSGHIITPYFNTGDGVLVALLLINVLQETNKTLKELTKDIIMYHDEMINIKVKDKTIINDSKLQNRIKEIENDLGSEGKVILRASGTEQLIRVSVMAKDRNKLDMYLKELVEMVNSLERVI